jgi:hypothetical protein
MTMNGFQYRILAPRADTEGCDEAHFYGLISLMRSYLPEGKDFSIVNRDTRPNGWSGPAGVSELEYRAKSSEPSYRLWIAPLSWQGQSPGTGSGAQMLGRDRCFQYFDQVTNTGNGDTVREKVIDALGLRG